LIQLTRDRSRVPAAFTGAGHVANEGRLRRQLPAREFTFSSAVWKKAKPRLRRESAGKCAYCESATEAVAHGDVEHFRPKSVYWWLAYCYDNYLFACQICNESYKGDRFPVAAARMRVPRASASSRPGGLGPDPTDAAAVARFLERCAAEKPLLADPYAIDPEPLFRWTADETLGEVRIEPRPRVGYVRRQAATTITELGLNREELLFWRFRHYMILSGFRLVIVKAAGLARDVAVDRVRWLMEGEQPYAAMARYFVREKWSLPV